MRWHPRAEQPTLLETFQPVYAPVRKRSRFVPTPLPAPVAVPASEVAQRAQIRAQQAKDTAAYLAELEIQWTAKMRQRGF